MAARVTFGTATAQLFQDGLDAASFDQYFDARNMTAGVFVNASAIGIARLRIDDGVDFSDSAANLLAAPGTPEFLQVEHEVNAAATRIRYELRVESAGAASWSAGTLLFGDVRPDRFVHPVTLPVSISSGRPGIAAATPLPGLKRIHRPFIASHTTVDAVTAPAGGADVYNWLKADGAGGEISIFSPGITLGATIRGSSFAVFTTYNARCFVPSPSTGYVNPTVGARVRGDIQSVAPTPASDITIELFGRAWARPQELVIAAHPAGLK